MEQHVADAERGVVADPLGHLRRTADQVAVGRWPGRPRAGQEGVQHHGQLKVIQPAIGAAE
jgi:hypothetical protein